MSDNSIVCGDVVYAIKDDGFHQVGDFFGDGVRETTYTVEPPECINKFIQQAILAERERCAKIIDREAQIAESNHETSTFIGWLNDIANEIRREQ